MDALPAFDPELHDEVARSQGLIPASMDGLTHYCSSRGDKTHPKCGAAQGTQLSRNWALVDCLDCRDEERPDPFAPNQYVLSTRRPGTVGGPS
ncbi:hypothetical protein [Streptomyces lancefieldiae]|uniref:Uncharacterized protein n=1 Tax=Streptomyces lancefieldiae TaxID=3075520 RepID=A0ABU3AJ46_9ACTN|nr:hypothetical protein [Streptomyces sp. DSM 40712]MDT0608911.1 hypothetical protein [Streptomyces sp. DSM 40712]